MKETHEICNLSIFYPYFLLYSFVDIEFLPFPPFPLQLPFLKNESPHSDYLNGGQEDNQLIVFSRRPMKSNCHQNYLIILKLGLEKTVLINDFG